MVCNKVILKNATGFNLHSMVFRLYSYSHMPIHIYMLELYNTASCQYVVSKNHSTEKVNKRMSHLLHYLVSLLQWFLLSGFVLCYIVPRLSSYSGFTDFQ